MTKAELKKLIDTLQGVIEEQRKIIEDLKTNSVSNVNVVPFIKTEICQHEYPMPWYGTVPPNCKKCGQQAPQFTITCSNGVGEGNALLVGSENSVLLKNVK